uniref:Uncharacterized protein n=1 Tax=Myoviridae sp. ctuIn11 TaxID=2827715 RepID=A0A8S5SI29_9CAUD|nr:MAG TPA: hypothetical protein [Myoviridae sp. ctuIn11]
MAVTSSLKASTPFLRRVCDGIAETVPAHR